MASGISMGARRDVLAAVAKRYRTAGRAGKGSILDELTATTAGIACTRYAHCRLSEGTDLDRH
jgi:hypothetical protein